MNAPTPQQPDKPVARPRSPSDSDEPELGAEEAVPSDGKDEEGEKMMEEMGRERRKREEDGR
jgi:hypothetical protein